MSWGSSKFETHIFFVKLIGWYGRYTKDSHWRKQLTTLYLNHRFVFIGGDRFVLQGKKGGEMRIGYAIGGYLTLLPVVILPTYNGEPCKHRGMGT